MSEKRVVMVVDMQIGVFATPRIHRAECVERINQLTRAADLTIFIQHTEAGGLEEGSVGFALLPELDTPANAKYVTKTACDAFYKTALEQLLREEAISHFVICGCATDYCRGYRITVAEDAHTTAHRPAAPAQTLIAHHNDVWRNLTVPDNPVLVKPVETILQNWKTN